jgi:hypothetical protein
MIWVGPFTSFGYGYFDEIPAAYVVKYLDFQTCMNFVKLNLWTWKDGTQSIFERLNAKLQNPRPPEQRQSPRSPAADGKVYRHGQRQGRGLRQAHRHGAAAVLPGVRRRHRSRRRTCSARIDYERYDVQAFLTKPEDHPETLLLHLRQHEVKERYGHLMVYYDRWRDAMSTRC